MNLNLADALNQLPDTTRFVLSYLCYECRWQRSDRIAFFPCELSRAVGLNQRGIDRALHRLERIEAIARDDKGGILVRWLASLPDVDFIETKVRRCRDSILD